MAKNPWLISTWKLFTFLKRRASCFQHCTHVQKDLIRLILFPCNHSEEVCKRAASVCPHLEHFGAVPTCFACPAASGAVNSPVWSGINSLCPTTAASPQDQDHLRICQVYYISLYTYVPLDLNLFDQPRRVSCPQEPLGCTRKQLFLTAGNYIHDCNKDTKVLPC